MLGNAFLFPFQFFGQCGALYSQYRCVLSVPCRISTKLVCGTGKHTECRYAKPILILGVPTLYQDITASEFGIQMVNLASQYCMGMARAK